jgi:hypothetical protein
MASIVSEPRMTDDASGEASGEALEAAVHAILRAHPSGVTEFALFAALAERGFAAFERRVFADTLRMFQSHFVLFHVLYAMRDRMVLRREGHLRIEATSIQLTPWDSAAASNDASARSEGLAEHDPMRDYYLDLDNLRTTTDESLRSMLGAFWERFHASDRAAEALEVFGLEPGASWDAIKARHRALVFEHHPDRGGDAARLAEINAAMRLLQTLRR